MRTLGQSPKGAGRRTGRAQHHLLNIPIGIAQAGAKPSGDWRWRQDWDCGLRQLVRGSRMNRWVAEREANYQKRVTGTPACNMAGNVGAAVGSASVDDGIGELQRCRPAALKSLAGSTSRRPQRRAHSWRRKAQQWAGNASHGGLRAKAQQMETWRCGRGSMFQAQPDSRRGGRYLILDVMPSRQNGSQNSTDQPDISRCASPGTGIPDSTLLPIRR